LDVENKTLKKRIKWKKKKPPLKKNNNYKIIKKIYLEKRKIYKLANHKIKCDKMNKSDLTEKIILLYEQQ